MNRPRPGRLSLLYTALEKGGRKPQVLYSWAAHREKKTAAITPAEKHQLKKTAINHQRFLLLLPKCSDPELIAPLRKKLFLFSLPTLARRGFMQEARMKFSTRTRYALRVMVDLASASDDEFVSLKQIAQKQDISIKYLEQIVPYLTRAGLLVSSRGAQGGYRLARKPSDYTPMDIVQAIEGSFAPVYCLTPQASPCSRMANCQTKDFWEGLQQTVNAYLGSMTLEELGSTNST